MQFLILGSAVWYLSPHIVPFTAAAALLVALPKLATIPLTAPNLTYTVYIRDHGILTPSVTNTLDASYLIN